MLLEFKQWLKFVGTICPIFCVFRGVLKTYGNRASFLHFSEPLECGYFFLRKADVQYTWLPAFSSFYIESASNGLL